MARRYVRDNRGRFATTAGGGATARGGRLRTAAGNKRATQTIEAAGRARVIGKPGKFTPKAVTMSREQFVARQGGSRADSLTDAIAAASPGGRIRMSKKQEARMVAGVGARAAATTQRAAKAGALYDRLQQSGRVRSPSRLESLQRTAQGMPENESTQAAKRLLAKRAQRRR